MSEQYNNVVVYSNKEWLGDFPVFSNLSGFDVVYDGNSDLSHMHIHEFVEISIVVEGTGVHLSLDGVRKCNVGDVYIINSGVPHNYFDEEVPRTLAVRNLLFNPAEIFGDDSTFSENPDYCYGIFRNNVFMPYMHLEPDKLDEILYILKKIEEETKSKKSQWQNSVKAHLTNLLINLSRNVSVCESDNHASLSHKDRIMVSKAMLSVLKNYNDFSLTLENIASSMFISKSYLSRIFKNATGKYFSEYIKEVRLNRACRLLRKTNKTIDEIVYTCGMKDLQSFYRLFKSTFSLTPNQYRKKFRNNR